MCPNVNMKCYIITPKILASGATGDAYFFNVIEQER
jgi:hypothetical protein